MPNKQSKKQLSFPPPVLYSYLPNPENEVLEKTKVEIRQQTERLTRESNKWEELLWRNTEEAEAAER